MSEELKPCPFCGKVPEYFPPERSDSGEMMHDGYRHACGNYVSGSYRDAMYLFCPADYNEWNNAYCWKELAAKDSEIKRYREALSLIAWGYTGDYLSGSACAKIAKSALHPSEGEQP